ncbi:hypothetical protein HDU91_005772 [Kappamyces sp. JEL0680]|nr:hypothetical protein HDU91_005772 [Kappamyces sp. JEL0680]
MTATLQRLTVGVRIRPLSLKEEEAVRGKNLMATVAKAVDERNVMVYDPVESYSGSKHREKIFEFDHVFGETADQQTIFDRCVRDQIESVLEGFNATVFCYGATGVGTAAADRQAGKTYTMMGNDPRDGIMGLTLKSLFSRIAAIKDPDGSYKVSISYLEIYNEKIRDLLTGKMETLELLEDPSKGVVVAGITYVIMGLLQKGNRNRIQEATGQNETSSRSHAILQVYVAYKAKDKSKSRFAKLSLCDLAGSERAAETNNKGIRMIEGASINRSLLALGNCINSLVEAGRKSDYVNYRDSKLTRLLKDSLGGASALFIVGNCQTVMIANISPCITNFDDTANTLKYASRARNIKTKVSQQTSELLAKSLQEFQEEEHRIKKEAPETKEPPAHAEDASHHQHHKPIALPASPPEHAKKTPLPVVHETPVQYARDIHESLHSLFIRQLDIRTAELDYEEHDANHRRRQLRLKFELGKLEAEMKHTKNEGKKKHLRSKVEKLNAELVRIQSFLAKNQSAKESLARDNHGADQKIFKLQEAAGKCKEIYFSQFVKAEVKTHHLEMKSRVADS